MYEKTLPNQIKAYFFMHYSAFPSIGIMKFYFFWCRKFLNKVTNACSFVRAYFPYSSWIYFENERVPEVSNIFKPVASRVIFEAVHRIFSHSLVLNYILLESLIGTIGFSVLLRFASYQFCHAFEFELCQSLVLSCLKYAISHLPLQEMLHHIHRFC